MRLYNGCPDKELQAIWDANRAAREEARSLGMSITYFPMEEKYMAFSLEDYSERSQFKNSPRAALEEAKTRL